MRPKLLKRPDNLTGPAALLTAVIYQATNDYRQGDSTAAAYFAGPVYRQHLELLGLPDDWLPDGMEKRMEPERMEPEPVDVPSWHALTWQPTAWGIAPPTQEPPAADETPEEKHARLRGELFGSSNSRLIWGDK